VALVEEVVKTGMAAAIFASKPRAVVQAALQGKKADANLTRLSTI
jgi:hypothetical protein